MSVSTRLTTARKNPAVAFFVCLLSLLSPIACDFAQAQQPIDPLAPGEAYVIVNAEGSLKSIWFQRFQRDDSFAILELFGAKLLRVKAGRYYLKRIVSVYSNEASVTYPEPMEPSQAIDIRPGVINYIGDWVFTRKGTASGVHQQLKVRYDGKTVRAIALKYDLKNIEILLVKAGEPAMKLELTSL